MNYCTKSLSIVEVSWCKVKALKSAGLYLSTQSDIINYKPHRGSAIKKLKRCGKCIYLFFKIILMEIHTCKKGNIKTNQPLFFHSRKLFQILKSFTNSRKLRYSISRNRTRKFYIFQHFFQFFINFRDSNIRSPFNDTVRERFVHFLTLGGSTPARFWCLIISFQNTTGIDANMGPMNIPFNPNADIPKDMLAPPYSPKKLYYFRISFVTVYKRNFKLNHAVTI